MFTYSVQMAGYDYEKVDEKGQTNYEDFIHAFDAFPWIEQLEERNHLQYGASATVSVSAADENKDLWVSIAGSKEQHAFLIGYDHIIKKREFWGLGKEKSMKWVDIFITEDMDAIRTLFNFFFDRQFSTLEIELSKLEMFDSKKTG